MKRFTIKDLRECVKMWNESQDIQLEIRSFNGYYHLYANGEMLVSGESSLKCWKEFQIWRSGYFYAMNKLNTK